jgi:hypothetical protein
MTTTRLLTRHIEDAYNLKTAINTLIVLLDKRYLVARGKEANRIMTLRALLLDERATVVEFLEGKDERN